MTYKLGARLVLFPLWLFVIATITAIMPLIILFAAFDGTLDEEDGWTIVKEFWLQATFIKGV